MSPPAISLHNVSRRFGALQAVRDVTFEVMPGERRAVIGPNGAGKTTLFNTICGDFPPSSGRIALFGVDITRARPHQRTRLGIGRTYQTSLLFNGLSVLENLFVAVRGLQPNRWSLLRPGRDDSALGKARALAERVQLSPLLDEPVVKLSHGQRRQLEIAIALALGSKAFLLDEPMAGMGPEGSRALTAFLGRLRAEAPILLVEHDMDAVFALADRVSVLVYGRVIASGTVDEIRADRQVRRAYLGDEA